MRTNLPQQIGCWRVIPLNSGFFRLDGGAMMGSVPKILWQKTNPADDQNRIDLALRCLLLDDGKSLVLIETGMGSKNDLKIKNRFHVQQDVNPLYTALERQGYNAEDITHVIITHLHFDHAGGATQLSDNGHPVPAFPNARYLISQPNWQAALNPNPRDGASYLPENFLPIRDSDQLDLIPENSQLLPGISTIAVQGHTAGQQLVKISGDQQTLVFCSDLIPLLSHLKLPWIMGYDLNAYQTLQEKSTFLEKAAANGWWLFFYHDPETMAVQISPGDKYFETRNIIACPDWQRHKDN